MGFKVFKRPLKRGRASIPCITINADGIRLGVSLDARKLLGLQKGDFVALYIDREDQRIGISKAYDGGYHMGEGTISCRDFIEESGFLPGRYPAKMSSNSILAATVTRNEND